MQHYKITICFNNFIYDNVARYEMKQLTLQANLMAAMRSQFREEIYWIDQMSLEKWT